ncbi:Aldose 1-epimerase [Lutibacter oricola]|uniref:Aldose 1-epimerase n=1 Tax=Lutibacter oricola TaxID=762486 RepID=A0A1H3F1Z3_9FLAO|nr:aldose epimerase [Lutibacter oricola]SDX84204.1 Aldose 1-epimerase [Lutibacter oricola]
MKLTSPNKLVSVSIENGELISYLKNGEELIHQKGSAGWRNSDTEMFPVIGPTSDKDYLVNTPKGNAVQDQHGILRELTYNLKNSSSNTAVFQKKYSANTIVKNSKFPEKSSAENLHWPYNFNFEKSFELTNNSLKITFNIECEKNMPFMLGYHPAFKLSGDNSEVISTSNNNISLQNIIDSGASAYPILNTSELTLVKEKGCNVNIKTSGYNNFMLWTEVPNMLCIEPITAYPYVEGKMLNKKLFNTAKETNFFEVLITPINK